MKPCETCLHKDICKHEIDLMDYVKNIDRLPCPDIGVTVEVHCKKRICNANNFTTREVVVNKEQPKQWLDLPECRDGGGL